METKEQKSLLKISENDIADIVFSLAVAFQSAGGTVPTRQILENVTAWEFIRNIAPNHIRFTVIPKET
jgi:phage-related protein